jgi:hypothetical protein
VRAECGSALAGDSWGHLSSLAPSLAVASRSAEAGLLRGFPGCSWRVSRSGRAPASRSRQAPARHPPGASTLHAEGLWVVRWLGVSSWDLDTSGDYCGTGEGVPHSVAPGATRGQHLDLELQAVWPRRPTMRAGRWTRPGRRADHRGSTLPARAGAAVPGRQPPHVPAGVYWLPHLRSHALPLAGAVTLNTTPGTRPGGTKGAASAASGRCHGA